MPPIALLAGGARLVLSTTDYPRGYLLSEIMGIRCVAPIPLASRRQWCKLGLHDLHEVFCVDYPEARFLGVSPLMPATGSLPVTNSTPVKNRSPNEQTQT